MADNIQTISGDEIARIFHALDRLDDGIRDIDELCGDYNHGRYITDRQLGDILNVSRRTLANYRAKGEFGYYDLPGKILYDEKEIGQFLQRYYLPPFRTDD